MFLEKESSTARATRLPTDPTTSLCAPEPEQVTASFELWVANAGNPIPASAMERLFEPFFRGDVRDSRQGLGLGLHIASQIAQAHGGRIDVTSTPDETRFIFAMPLNQGMAGRPVEAGC